VERILVIVRLRGACDGLNLVAPGNDPNYIAARIADLRVLSEGTDAGHPLPNGPGKDIDWRLHPAATELASLYDAGHLAIVHAAGLTDANRSHFVATDMMDHGVGDTASLARIEDGWLARYLQSNEALVAAVTAASIPDGALRGDPRALSIPDASYGFAPPGGADFAEVLDVLYRDNSSAAQTFIAGRGREALQAMRLVDSRIPRDTHGKPLPYLSDPPGLYDPSAEFGRGLKTLAQLIKSGLPISVATVDIGNWDTHENQPGRFRGLAQKLSSGLGAFTTDLKSIGDRLVLVAYSEFGRRLRSNRSNGTDHGRGGVMLVLGEKVNGGRIYGRWPGLADAQLEEGVDLAVTTDYRGVLNEVLSNHGMSTPAASTFPGFKAPSKLGLFHS
jgi:uncharacterized protein (DUF1501 family)